MLRRTCAVLLGTLGWAGCRGGHPGAAPAPRMEVRRLTNNTVALVPSPGQLPYCLVYTRSAKGITRLLTLHRGDQSVECSAGQPVMGVRFRIPVDEGEAKIYTVFSDQKLQATKVTEQLVELVERPAFSAMDLRLPGRVVVDQEAFVPSEEALPVMGERVDDAGAGGPKAPAAPPEPKTEL